MSVRVANAIPQLLSAEWTPFAGTHAAVVGKEELEGKQTGTKNLLNSI